MASTNPQADASPYQDETNLEDEFDKLLAELPTDVTGVREPEQDFPFFFQGKADQDACWNQKKIGPLKDNGQWWSPILIQLRDEYPPYGKTWNVSCMAKVYADVELQQARQGQRPLMHLFQSILNLHKAMMAWNWAISDVRRVFEDLTDHLAPQLSDAMRGRAYCAEGEGDTTRSLQNESIYFDVFLHTIIGLNLLDSRDYVLLNFETCRKDLHFVDPLPLYNNINYVNDKSSVDPHKDIVPPKRTTKPYTRSEMPPPFSVHRQHWLQDWLSV